MSAGTGLLFSPLVSPLVLRWYGATFGKFAASIAGGATESRGEVAVYQSSLNRTDSAFSDQPSQPPVLLRYAPPVRGYFLCSSGTGLLFATPKPKERTGASYARISPPRQLGMSKFRAPLVGLLWYGATFCTVETRILAGCRCAPRSNPAPKHPQRNIQAGIVPLGQSEVTPSQ